MTMTPMIISQYSTLHGMASRWILSTVDQFEWSSRHGGLQRDTQVINLVWTSTPFHTYHPVDTTQYVHGVQYIYTRCSCYPRLTWVGALGCCGAYLLVRTARTCVRLARLGRLCARAVCVQKREVRFLAYIRDPQCSNQITRILA